MTASVPDASAATAPDPLAEVDDGVFYPCSDGRPMAENTWQAQAIIHAASDLAVALPEPFVAADILVYPERGNRYNSIAPDVLVAFGVGRHHRMSYFVWREGKPPDWVLEVASPSTAARDLELKRCRYAEMGVGEYWLFDPTGKLFRRRGEAQLQGYALTDGSYEPLDAVAADGEAMIRSDMLRLGLRAENELIRFRDLATGEDIRHRDESEARLAESEARVAELETLLRQMQSDSSGPRS